MGSVRVNIKKANKGHNWIVNLTALTYIFMIPNNQNPHETENYGIKGTPIKEIIHKTKKERRIEQNFTSLWHNRRAYRASAWYQRGYADDKN